MTPTVKRQIRIADDLWDSAITKAHAEGITVSELIRHWLDEYVGSMTWVMQIEFSDDYGGYTSIHHSEAGAYESLMDRCRALGVTITSVRWRDLVASGELDNEPMIASYGISRLPVGD